jgi:hypothetical protein
MSSPNLVFIEKPDGKLLNMLRITMCCAKFPFKNARMIKELHVSI